ncbi:MAG: hypothetical protein ACI9UU_002998, partial [Candidatus Azotimanducaceae bacterium]
AAIAPAALTVATARHARAIVNLRKFIFCSPSKNNRMLTPQSILQFLKKNPTTLFDKTLPLDST